MNRYFNRQALTVGTVLYTLCSTLWAFPQSDQVAFRQIVVASEQEARDVRSKLTAGISFENLAGERSQDPTARRGGYVGQMRRSDLRTEIQQALERLAPGEVTSPIKVGDAYLLLQIVPEKEALWIDLDDAGAQALSEGRSADAVKILEKALAQAESAKLDNSRLAISLDTLASAYRLEKRPVDSEKLYRRAQTLLESMKAPEIEIAQVLSGLGMALAAQSRFTEAQPLYERALSIREKLLGPDDPEVGAILHNLAEVYAGQKRFAEATKLYEKSRALLEKSLGPNHPASLAGAQMLQAFRRSLMPELLERFSTLVNLSEFQDRSFDRTVTEIRELLSLAPLSEHSYVQIKDILLTARLTEQTELFLRSGLERFPDSRVIRIYLADVLAGTGRTQDALTVLEQAAELAKPDALDPGTDGQQRSILYQRIGDLQAALTHFDEAIAAYKRSLELDPASPAGRLKLGRAYFSAGQLDKAQAEFEGAIKEMPDDKAYLKLSETHLAAGSWEQAATAASGAIDLGTTDSQVLYLLGTSLIRMGRVGEGQEKLQEFAKVEAGFQEAEHRNRDIEAISVAAVRALREGNGDAAIQQLKQGVATYADSDRLHMDLALVQSRLGQHKDAVKTLESMLERRLGRRFLIHKNLADEYEILGDADLQRRHLQIYLEAREAELLPAAPQ